MSLDESLDSSMEDATKEERSSKLQVKFASCLITLRTLAKFLGFLVFSPYHHSGDFPQTVKETLISARNQV
jgi:codanin-1